MPNERSLSWSPRPAVVAVGWALTAAAVLAAVVIDDVRGTILLVIAAFVLGALALFWTVARPRLAADQHGITVRGLFGARRWSWGEVNVRLVVTRRLGRENSAVEIDADSSLVLLGQLDLGADPQDVTADLLGLRT